MEDSSSFELLEEGMTLAAVDRDGVERRVRVAGIVSDAIHFELTEADRSYVAEVEGGGMLLYTEYGDGPAESLFFRDRDELARALWEVRDGMALYQLDVLGVLRLELDGPPAT